MYRKIFKNRSEAGEFLAEKLTDFANRDDVVVLALPRGGVPVAYEVANRLKAPLDVFVVRKLGVPGHEELAMGAVASGSVRVLNPDVLSYVRIHEAIIDRVTEFEKSELQRREQLYRGNRPPLSVEGQTVIIVDDGLATGSTMRAAVKALQQKHPKKIIVAVPVGARETCKSFQNEADTMVVCAFAPEPFQAVGLWYADFSQTTDKEVRDLLARADRTKAAA